MYFFVRQTIRFSIVSMVCMVFYSVNIHAQTGDFVFETYNEMSDAWKVEKTPDEYLIMMNNSQVMKTDLEGNMIWIMELTDFFDGSLTDLVVSSDSNIICSANFNLSQGYFGEGTYPGIVRFDADAGNLWFYSPFANNQDSSDVFRSATVNGITHKENGNFVLTGAITDYENKSRLLLFEMDPGGDTLWTFYDAIYNNNLLNYHGEKVIQADDSNIYVTGTAFYNGPSVDNPSNALIAGFTTQGDTIFTRLCPEDNITGAHERGIDLISFDNAILSLSLDGGIYSNEHYVYYREWAYDGTLNTTHVLGQDMENWEFNYLATWYISELSDGGFINTTMLYNDPPYDDMSLIARFDANLNMSWLRLVGDTAVAGSGLELMDAVELDDGRLAFAGENPDYKAVLLITSPTGDGNYPNELIMDKLQYTLKDVTLFPNPVNEKLTVCTGTGEAIRFRLYDIYGKLIKTFDVRGNRELNVSDLQSGIYILKAGKFHPKKIVVQ
ncbi:MAG: T9SS type A sorting domain-containing protein [Bacteroidota bacterium]